MDNPVPSESYLGRFGSRSAVVGVVALALCGAGLLTDPEAFYQSYLTAYVFWSGLALGCLALFMLHNLVGGRWGFLIRRFLEAASKTFPLLALLFLPVILGMRHLYIWTDPEVVAADPVLAHKQPYLNEPFFILRAAFYFAVWILFAWLLRRWSLEQDRTGDGYLTRKLELLSGPGLVAYGLTVTFASFDWIMSLEPHWFSTIYGLIFMTGQGISAFAFGIILLVRLSDVPPLSERYSPKLLRDLGTLTFAFVMLWAYVTFSQYLIIWSANLPEEIPWYIQRASGGWQVIAGMVVLFHFAVPFSLLLSRYLKLRTQVMVVIAGQLLVMRYVDIYWHIAPAFGGHGAEGPSTVHVHWTHPVALVGIGGLWLWYFARHLNGTSLVPQHDPRLEEAFAGGEGH